MNYEVTKVIKVILKPLCLSRVSIHFLPIAGCWLLVADGQAQRTAPARRTDDQGGDFRAG